MAISKINEANKLQLAFEDGMNGDKPKIVTKTFSKIKAEATPENLHDFATSMADLQSRPVHRIYVDEKNRLIEE